MKRIAAILALMILCSALPGLAGAAEVPVSTSILVLGRAPAGANEAQAREAATNDALRRAVAQVVLEMLDPALLRGRLEVLEREVLAKASRFVTTFSLQTSYRGSEGMLALVAVGVDRPALEKALAAAGLRQSGLSLPLVLALVSEEAGPGRPPAFWWGEAAGQGGLPQPLQRAVSAAGLKLVEPSLLAGKIPPAYRQANLTTEQALDLARQCGAGLVLLGRLRTYPLVSQPGQAPAPLAQLQALEVSGGQVVGKEEAAGPTFSATPGPEAAAQINQAAEEAIARLLRLASGGVKPPEPVAEEPVLVELSGLRSLAELNRFEQVLRGLKASVGQVRREAVGGGGKASLRCTLKVPAAKLADELMVQNYGDFLVNVVEASPNLIRLAVVGK